MAATLNRVKCGDPLIVSASTFNTFIDAARAHKQQQHGTHRSPQQDQRQTGIVLVHNASGMDRARFNVLGISGPAIAPVDNPEEFASRVALSGVTPTEDHAGRFVVLFGPVGDGAIGRAYVDGVCPALVKMADEDHAFADVEAGQAGRLLSAAAGSAALLWVEPVEDRDDPSIARALVRIGGAGSASAPEYSIRFVRITGVTGDSPPYLYSATQVECLTAGTWTTAGGGMAWSGTLRNQAEHSGGGAASIPIGAVVMVVCVNRENNIWEIAGRLEYRGTYG